MRLIIFILIIVSASISDQMYIYIENGNKGQANALLRQITQACTGNAGNAQFVLGETRVGVANGKIIWNNTEGPAQTYYGWAYELDSNIVADWGDSIESFIENHPSQVADIYYITRPLTREAMLNDAD